MGICNQKLGKVTSRKKNHRRWIPTPSPPVLIRLRKNMFNKKLVQSKRKSFVNFRGVLCKAVFTVKDKNVHKKFLDIYDIYFLTIIKGLKDAKKV